MNRYDDAPEDPRELAEQVRSDLDQIEYTWQKNDANPALIRDSVILRRLLVESMLQRAWKVLGRQGQPSIVHHAIDDIFAPEYQRTVMVAFAGVIERPGVKMRNCFMAPERPPEDVRQKFMDAGEKTRSTLLSDFVEAPVLLIEGRKVRNREVIKYFANKRGGAHYDRKRQRAEDETARLLDRFSLRSMPSRVEFVGKDIVFAALMSIGTALLSSPDITALRAELRGA